MDQVRPGGGYVVKGSNWIEFERYYCPTMQGGKPNQEQLYSHVELDPEVTGFHGCKCKRGFIESTQSGNWGCKDPDPFKEYTNQSDTISDKAGAARLRKGQSTEFHIRPHRARVIHIDISQFTAPENETTTLELYEGHDILNSTPKEKWSDKNRPEQGEITTVYRGAATLSGVSYFTLP